jgi:hypothetical protein
MCWLVTGEAFHSRGVIFAQGTPEAIRDEDAVRFSGIHVESRRDRRKEEPELESDSRLEGGGE